MYLHMYIHTRTRAHTHAHTYISALSRFQALDKNGDGLIDKQEFAQIFNLDPDCDKTTYMFNALDVDRNGQLNYKVRQTSVCLSVYLSILACECIRVSVSV